MANNQLPPCSFSATGCLQWWAFTPVIRHLSQDLGPEMGGGGGRLLQGGPILRTVQYL